MLAHDKQQKIIALISNGSSRRMAAKYVRCSPSTITRTAARDPAFADQLAAAEQAAEIDALRALRLAARKDRYWRAAAWILERKNPEDFALRPPTLFTGEEVFQMFSIIVEILQQDIPEENCQKAIEKLEELIEIHRLEQLAPAYPTQIRDCPDFCVNKNGTVPFAVSIAPTLPPDPSPLQHPSFESFEVTTFSPVTTLEFTSTSTLQH